MCSTCTALPREEGEELVGVDLVVAAGIEVAEHLAQFLLGKRGSAVLGVVAQAQKPGSS